MLILGSMIDCRIGWRICWLPTPSEVQEVLQLEAAQMFDACYYSPVIVHVVFAIYLPLPYFGQIEHRPSC